MFSRHLLAIPVFSLTLLMPNIAISICEDVTWCFCALSPSDCEVLISAEVIELGYNTCTLRVHGKPHYDPNDVLQDGQLIENLETRLNLTVGRTGLFLVHPPGSCFSSDLGCEHCISYFLPESDGKFLCVYDQDFSGATLAEVLSAVLSPNCKSSVYDLGVESHCSHGLCAGSTISVYSFDGLFLFIFFICFVTVYRSLSRRN